ncbi:hypothetical protein B0H14DRAFT_2579680 [Mycena olivaceomarginata]|nr:hypothetical protein B0H14DRAFT_2579680 [Mycena olivaceomarginata]
MSSYMYSPESRGTDATIPNPQVRLDPMERTFNLTADHGAWRTQYASKHLTIVPSKCLPGAMDAVEVECCSGMGLTRAPVQHPHPAAKRGTSALTRTSTGSALLLLALTAPDRRPLPPLMPRVPATTPPAHHSARHSAADAETPTRGEVGPQAGPRVRPRYPPPSKRFATCGS